MVRGISPERSTSMAATDTRVLPIGAAFDRMPFTRRHVLIALALFIAFVIESWEQLALIYVSADLGSAFGIDEGGIGLVTRPPAWRSTCARPDRPVPTDRHPKRSFKIPYSGVRARGMDDRVGAGPCGGGSDGAECGPDV